MVRFMYNGCSPTFYHPISGCALGMCKDKACTDESHDYIDWLEQKKIRQMFLKVREEHDPGFASAHKKMTYNEMWRWIHNEMSSSELEVLFVLLDKMCKKIQKKKDEFVSKSKINKRQYDDSHAPTLMLNPQSEIDKNVLAVLTTYVERCASAITTTASSIKRPSTPTKSVIKKKPAIKKPAAKKPVQRCSTSS